MCDLHSSGFWVCKMEITLAVRPATKRLIEMAVRLYGDLYFSGIPVLIKTDKSGKGSP